MIDNQKSKPDFPHSLDSDQKLQSLVETFYLENFWHPLNIEQIQNQTNADSFFDFAVNTGSITSARIVQSIVGTKIDGIIGQQSLYKINSIDALNAFILALNDSADAFVERLTKKLRISS